MWVLRYVFTLPFQVLGIVRVPLFKLYDNKGGFPAFLKNNFVGISKEQLIIGIHKSNLLSSAALEGYLSGSPESHLVQDFRYENSKHWDLWFWNLRLCGLNQFSVAGESVWLINVSI